MRIRVSRRPATCSLEEISGLLPDELDVDEPSASPQDELPAATGNPLEPPFLTLRDASEWLGVSRSTLKRLIAKGDLITVRVGARQRVPASYLAQYVARDTLFPSDALSMQQNEQYRFEFPEQS